VWAKLDDKFPRHPKVRQCSVEARWLFIVGVCHAAEYLTDGFLRSSDVVGLTAELRRPKVAIQQLVKVGLWEKRRGGYTIHDFLQYNPSRRQVETERTATRQRVHAWRGRNAVTNGVSNGSPVPSSSRPSEKKKEKEKAPGGEPEQLIPMPERIRQQMHDLFAKPRTAA